MIRIFYYETSINQTFLNKNNTKIIINNNSNDKELKIKVHLESLDSNVLRDFEYNINKEYFKGIQLTLRAFSFNTEKNSDIANMSIIDPIYVNTDTNPHKQSSYNASYMILGRLYIPKDYINNPILFQSRLDIPNENIFDVENDTYELNKLDYTVMNVDGFFCRYSQEYADLFNDWKLKYSNITGMTSISDSVAYLEEEVDLLYKILNVLLTRFSSEIDISEYKELLDTINSNSVINIKSKDKILNDLKTHKNRVRNLQENYYKEKYEGNQ